jgi:hypothetical protein
MIRTEAKARLRYVIFAVHADASPQSRIAFFLVVTPIGLLQRLFGKRIIEVAFRANAASYWQARTTHPVPEDYEKQF